MDKVTMYGLDKGEGIKQWSCWTEGDTIFVEHGKEGGKMQVKKTVCAPKNVGRSNETTAEQQASSEAQSKVNKQHDKGYRLNKDDLGEIPILPMLAADYLKQGHRIQFPCFASAKMDGVRCLAIKQDDKVTLLSRGGKEYSVPHIQMELYELMKEGEIFDGELYIHGEYLQDITSAVKKANENTCRLKFVIFDMFLRWAPKMNFDNRLAALWELQGEIELLGLGSISVIHYIKIDSAEVMKVVHDEMVQAGYEGIMLRNLSGIYEPGKRSADLQKYKEFLDSEFLITDVREDKSGNAVWTVQNTFGKNTFEVVGGTFEERKAALQQKELYIGKIATVKYQSLYKDTMIPQFPVLVAIRDYE